jgi:ribose 5-phosphate isomerase A
LSELETASGPTYLDELGEFALRYVKPGQTLGLGTGHAASAFIRALGEAKIGVRGVPTSNASAEFARSLGIELIELREVTRLDADFDGADEVDPRLDMIKGNGGALVREKIVAAASRRRIFLVGAEKCVKYLGAFGNLPVEVMRFATSYAAREIAKLGLKPKLRMDQNGSEFVTDNGNSIFDCRVGKISNPRRLERELLAIPGIIGTGLFIGMADVVLIASSEKKVKTIRRPR